MLIVKWRLHGGWPRPFTKCGTKVSFSFGATWSLRDWRRALLFGHVVGTVRWKFKNRKRAVHATLGKSIKRLRVNARHTGLFGFQRTLNRFRNNSYPPAQRHLLFVLIGEGPANDIDCFPLDPNKIPVANCKIQQYYNTGRILYRTSRARGSAWPYGGGSIPNRSVVNHCTAEGCRPLGAGLNGNSPERIWWFKPCEGSDPFVGTRFKRARVHRTRLHRCTVFVRKKKKIN